MFLKVKYNKGRVYVCCATLEKFSQGFRRVSQLQQPRSFNITLIVSEKKAKNVN